MSDGLEIAAFLLFSLLAETWRDSWQHFYSPSLSSSIYCFATLSLCILFHATFVLIYAYPIPLFLPNLLVNIQQCISRSIDTFI